MKTKKMNGFAGIFALLAALVILFLVSLFFVSCSKDPVLVGKPTVFSFEVVDTTYDENGSAAILTAEYHTDAVIGVVPDGYYGGYLHSTGECQFEVTIGVRTPLVITACNSKGDPNLIMRDTLWVCIFPRSIGGIITKPTLSLSYINVQSGKTDTLNYGGGQIQITAKFTDGELYLNGVPYYSSPTTFTFDIKETKTFKFSVKVNGGDVVVDSISIPVHVPNQTELWLWDYKGWTSDYMEYTLFSSGETTRDVPVVVTSVIFYPDGTALATYPSGPRIVSWSFENNFTQINWGGLSDITFLNNGESMVTSSNGNYGRYSQHWIHLN